MFDVLKYIHDNIEKPLVATDVAKRFGYSKWYFCSKFHKVTGRSFVEYVRHYRIQLAALDILKGEKIAAVAIGYGYDSVSGFNKAFLREYGCNPKEYIKETKNAMLYYKRRRTMMFQLTDRCERLRDIAVNTKIYEKQYDLQRNVYYVIGGDEARKNGCSDDEIVAKAIACVVENFKPFIAPDEIIVGVNFGRDDMIFPYNADYSDERIRENGISETDFSKALSADKDIISSNFRCGGHIGESIPVNLTTQEIHADKDRAITGRCVCNNHSVIGYEKVLKLGFEGLLKEIEKYESINGKSSFYEGQKIVCLAAMKIGDNYAKEASRLISENNPEYNKDDLLLIESICRNVPRKPAENFREAVQSLWFAHILNTWEDCINANSLGHLDTILYPYYKKDIDAGVLTKEEAFEIICCLWIKLYRDYDVQQACLGGTNPDGSGRENDLSYMMLDATESLDFVRCLSVRFSSNTDKNFLIRALEVVGHVQKGVPFFFNDDVMIPALMSKGISKEDAHDYAQIGCVETLIPGKTNPYAVSGETNFLKAIEYVLCRGRSLMNETYECGVDTGSLDELDTFKKFYQAVLSQITNILDLTCSTIKKHRNAIKAPKPYKSLLTEGCLEKGTDFNDKGAVYDYYQVMFEGIPNLADSLMVIRKFVYDDKKYTLHELKQILSENFPDEAVRLEFVNKAPKFGNDIDEVDEVAAALINHGCDVLEKLSEKYEMDFHAQPFTYVWMLDKGEQTAASPDGRRKGEPLAYSMSPMQGRDFSGLTAVLNSISSLPTKRTPGTTSAIIEVDPKLFNDRNIGILADLMLASAKKGLSNIQFNTIDAETLIDAQKNPEKYNNLAVRVSGFSQKFNLLSPEMQSHIIGRTKHSCL